MQPTAAAAVLQPHQPRQDEEAASGPSAARQDGKLWRVTLSVCIYWVSVSLVPVYNKKIFSNRVYPYPVATAAIQLGMVSAVLCVLSVLKHFVADGRRGWGKGAQRPEGYQALGGGGTELAEGQPGSRPAPEPSWVFGPHLAYKLWAVGPVGILFGLKYGVTNWGLHLVPTGTHLLLQATDLLWTVLAAWIINGEKQGFVEALACAGTLVGSILIGLRLNQSIEAPLLPLIVNLMSPILLGLCISMLRRATVLLMGPDSPFRGTVSSAELTCHKLYLSSISAAACALLIEGLDVFGTLHGKPTFWEALGERPWALLGLAGGAGLVLIFQVNITWLSALTTATAVGIVGGVKVVPQWLVNLMFVLEVDVNPLNLAGAAIVMASSIMWTLCRMHKAGLVRAHLPWKT